MINSFFFNCFSKVPTLKNWGLFTYLLDKLFNLGYTIFSAFRSFFIIISVRAGSSPGRAPHLHCGGSGFKSCPVHDLWAYSSVG